MDNKDNASPLVQFIRRNFMGATITVTFVFGGTLTGEVVDGFDNVLGLKVGTVVVYINADLIVFFF